MTHLVHDLPDLLFTLISGVANVFVLFGVIYLLKCIFQLEFICSCETTTARHEWAFIICPAIIIWLVVCLFKPKVERITKYNCCKQFLYIIRNLVASFVFWGSAVLLEGDWWLCIFTKKVPEHQNISCKHTSDLTIEEEKVSAQHKSDSLFWGLIVIIAALLLWCVIVFINECYKRSKLSYYQRFYEESLQEATEKHLKEELTKIAEMRANKICSKRLENIRYIQGLTFKDKDKEKEWMKDGKVQLKNAWSEILSPGLYALEETTSLENLWLQFYEGQETERLLTED